MSRNSRLNRPFGSLRIVAVMAVAALIVGCTGPTPTVPATEAPAAPPTAAPTDVPMPEPTPTMEAVVEETEAPAEMTPEGEAMETPEAETPEATAEAEMTPSEGTQTAGALAAAGQEVLAASCAMCHGEGGTGGGAPELIGETAQEDLSTDFGDAQALFEFIHTNMPANAPGSLSEEQYRDVTAHILLENGWVQEDDELSIDTFGEITLE